MADISNNGALTSLQAYQDLQSTLGVLTTEEASELWSLVDALDVMDNAWGDVDGEIHQPLLFSHTEDFAQKLVSLAPNFSASFHESAAAYLSLRLFPNSSLLSDDVVPPSFSNPPVEEVGSQKSSPSLAFAPSSVKLFSNPVASSVPASGASLSVPGLTLEEALPIVGPAILMGNALYPAVVQELSSGSGVNPNYDPYKSSYVDLVAGSVVGWMWDGEEDSSANVESPKVHEDPAYPEDIKPIIVEQTPINEEEAAPVDNSSISMMADRGPKPKPPAGSEGAEVTFNDSNGYWECDGKYYAGGKWHSTLVQALLAKLASPPEVKAVDAVNAPGVYQQISADAANAPDKPVYELNEAVIAGAKRVHTVNTEASSGPFSVSFNLRSSVEGWQPLTVGFIFQDRISFNPDTGQFILAKNREEPLEYEFPDPEKKYAWVMIPEWQANGSLLYRFAFAEDNAKGGAHPNLAGKYPDAVGKKPVYPVFGTEGQDIPGDDEVKLSHDSFPTYAYGGELKFDSNGRIIEMNNKSGHFADSNSDDVVANMNDHFVERVANIIWDLGIDSNEIKFSSTIPPSDAPSQK